MSFQPNQSLDRALRRAFWKEGVPILQRIRIRRALADDLLREEIEYSLTQKAMEMGAIAPRSDGVSAEGLFVGDWITDLLDWIIENWDVILEMIMTIIGLFSAEEEVEQ